MSAQRWTHIGGLAAAMFRRPVQGGPFDPPRVTAILTEHCHLRCEFCHLWKSPRSGATSAEWLSLFRANPRLRWVNLSGGEVFAQEGLTDLLLGIVAVLPRLGLLDFPTAGQRPDLVRSAVMSLLGTSLPRLVVSVSIDGGPEIHDELRGAAGAFERAVESYRTLRAIRDRRFSVRIGCTLTARAREQVETLKRSLASRIAGFRDSELHFNLAHHSSHYYRNASFARLPDESAVDVLESLRAGFGPIGWLEWIYARLARRAVREHFPPMGCAAIHKTLFIAPDWTVYPCSIWDRPLGNLHDFEGSITALLAEDTARLARAQVDAHQCPGCMTPCEAVPAILARPFHSTWLALR